MAPSTWCSPMPFNDRIGARPKIQYTQHSSGGCSEIPVQTPHVCQPGGAIYHGTSTYIASCASCSTATASPRRPSSPNPATLSPNRDRAIYSRVSAKLYQIPRQRVLSDSQLRSGDILPRTNRRRADHRM